MPSAFNLEGKTARVTGASRSIGRATELACIGGTGEPATGRALYRAGEREC